LVKIDSDKAIFYIKRLIEKSKSDSFILKINYFHFDHTKAST